MKRLSKLWRVVLAVAVLLVVVGGIAHYAGLLRLIRPGRAGNEILVIAPYKYAGTWVIDDPSVGLSREPFVSGIPEMINELVKDIPDAEKGFRLFFSARPFPGHTHKLLWRRGDSNGNWYYCEKFDKEGWLCPALFRYYPKAPKEIYIRAEKK